MSCVGWRDSSGGGQDKGYVIASAPRASAEVRGTADRFQVHRIYCRGRNYADHAREIGGDMEREPPFFFMKPAEAVVPSGATIP